MPLFIIASFGLLISWPITLSEATFDQTHEIIDDITEESESDSSIEDEDLSYDWLDEDEDEENMNYDWSDLQESLDDSSIEDKDIDYDLLSEDYLDYDNWSNETERETRELRFKKAYQDVTISSTGNYNLGYILYISYLWIYTS